MQPNHVSDPILDAVISAARASAKLPLPEVVTREHCFVQDLGFDSMSIARLALELEDRLDQAVLLNDWIAGETDPSSLTVGSLCRFVASLREESDAAV